MSAPTPRNDSEEPPRRRRKFRLLALGALTFLFLEIGLLAILPHHDQRGRLLAFILTDALLAAVVGVILAIALRKK